MIKHQFLLLGALLVTHALNAQTIERQVVSSGGGYNSASGVSISSTVGDLVINTSTVGSFTLTQGFQQSTLPSTGVDMVKTDVKYQLYPNPASNEISLSLQSTNKVTLSFLILDVSGKLIYRLNNESSNGNAYQHTFNVSGYAAGNYFMKIVDLQGSNVQTIPFTKQ
jgi:hypothetical protein